MTAATISMVPRQNLTQRGTKITWEDPPPVGQNLAGPYAAFTEALRANPGAWAILKEVPREHAKRAWSLSSRINRHHGKDFADPGYEAVARTVGNVVKVYVRYQPVTAVQA
jgi:hypothetical protein